MTTTRLLQGEITDSLIVEQKGATGWITFNDPGRHNAMSYDMWVGVPIALKLFEEDAGVRSVVLTGAGGKGGLTPDRVFSRSCKHAHRWRTPASGS